MLLDRKTFLVKEQVEFMKLSGTYDIYDPESGTKIGVAKEEPGGLIKFLRLVMDKSNLPNHVNVYDAETNTVQFYIKKPFSFIRSNISIFSNDGQYLGYFKSKVFTIGGGFIVYDSENQQLAEIKGDWKGWNFKFLDNNGNEIGTVTKKWAGIGKELFTSADNYVISINDMNEYSRVKSMLLLAAGIAIDTVFKEKNK